MRPDIPQKIAGAAPSNSNEDRSPLVDTRAFVTSEVSRHSCNAAMLGVALSVGACSSLMLPAFNQVAQAADPVAVGPAQAAESTANQQSDAAQIAVITPIGNTPSNATLPKAAIVPDPVIAKPAVGQAVSENGHTVRAGDSLWRIAKNYGVDIATLANLNQLQPDTTLKVGQVLQLPSSVSRNNGAGNGVTSQGLTSLQAIAQSVPEVPVITTNRQDVASSSGLSQQDDLKAQQTRSIDLLRQKRNQLQQRLAELGEESKTNAMPESLGLQGTQSASGAADTAATLPVTTLSQTPLPAIGGEAPKPIALNGAVVSTESSVADPKTASFNTSSLLSEIQGIRDRYQRQVTPYAAPSAAQLVAAKPADTVVPTLGAAPAASTTVPVTTQTVATAPAKARLEATTVPVNPDFGSRKTDSSLSIELRNFVQPKLKPEDTGVKVVASPSQQRQVIARSTLGSEAYAPVAPAVKRMVAPNLPAIGREDMYLPGGLEASSGYVWPAQGMLSSGYGWRWGRMHRGIDIAAPIGTPIVAAAGGVVSYAGWNDGGYGYLVEVDHPDGTMTRYAHNDRILVREGQQVAQGQQISEMGSTGFSTGPHLHFEIHPRGQGAVNPMSFLNSQS